MFRTSYVHLQEDNIVLTALYGMFFMHLCKQSKCFNSFLLVFYMFRASYVNLQEDNIVHTALYGMCFMHLCKQCTRLNDVLDVRFVG